MTLMSWTTMSQTFRKENMTTEKTPLKIDRWDGGILTPNAVNDPREHDNEADYDKWMEAQGWSQNQEIGSDIGGFCYEVWAWKEPGRWIMSINDGSACYDVLVEGLANYLDFMALMAPIATASMLEGDTLSSIFASHRDANKQRLAMQKIGESIIEKVNDAMAPCDCPACEAKKEELAKQQASHAN